MSSESERQAIWRPIESAPKIGSVRLSGDHGATWVYVKWDRYFWTDGEEMWTQEETSGWLWAPSDIHKTAGATS